MTDSRLTALTDKRTDMTYEFRETTEYGPTYRQTALRDLMGVMIGENNKHVNGNCYSVSDIDLLVGY